MCAPESSIPTKRALASIGVEVERGADRWGPKPAEIASVVGALEAARRA